MRTRLKWEWEKLGFHSDDGICGVETNRAKVIGGWLVRTVAWNQPDKAQSESMVFIPDKEHQWVIIQDEDKGGHICPQTATADDFDASVWKE